MASPPTVVRYFPTRTASPDVPTSKRELPSVDPWREFLPEVLSAAARDPGPLRRVAAPLLTLLAVALVGVRQLSSLVTVASPLTDAEARLGANAYALLDFPELALPSSLSETVVSWQVVAYSVLSSATDRHDSLVGSTREFVLVLTVLTALLVVAICRRLLLGWISCALALAFIGVPAVAATARIVEPGAAIATFWLAVAAISALVVFDRRGRRSEAKAAAGSPRTAALTWLFGALCAVASALALMSSAVSALVLLGVALGFFSGRPVGRTGTPTLRATTVVSLCVALVGASWLCVWGPGVAGTHIPALEGAGVAIALGGLVMAAACSSVSWLRPLAVAALPIMAAAAWPGPAQAAALLLGLTVVAVLAAGLLDALVGEGRTELLSKGLFPAPARLAAAMLLVAATAAALLIPSSVPASATPLPGAAVAEWIETQLLPDATVEVNPLNRAELVRLGLEPTRLTTAGRGDAVPDVRLAPLDSMTELPLLASFGSGSGALGVRLVVSDPAAFAAAQVTDRAARSEFGAALARNGNLTLSPEATTSLRAGDVDSRLMIGLAAASASVRVAIAEFTAAAGAPDEGSVLREANLTDITDLDPSVGATETSLPALRWLAQFFRTQLPPYQPLSVAEVDNSLSVGYPAPSPLGLLP